MQAPSISRWGRNFSTLQAVLGFEPRCSTYPLCNVASSTWPHKRLNRGCGRPRSDPALEVRFWEAWHVTGPRDHSCDGSRLKPRVNIRKVRKPSSGPGPARAKRPATHHMTKSPVLRACKHTQAPRAVGACCQRGLGRPAVIPLDTHIWAGGFLGRTGCNRGTANPRTGGGIHPTGATIPSRSSRPIAGRNYAHLSVSNHD